MQQLLQDFADAVRFRHARFLDMPAERLAVYQELVGNNVRGFVFNTFPVLRQILGDERLGALVQDFFAESAMHTPYFIEIPEHFLRWLPTRQAELPPFAQQLAHYEWLELALYRADEELPAAVPFQVELPLRLSPLASVQQYQFPVHQLSVEFQPDGAVEPTWLALYRDRADEVKFLLLTPLSASVLQIVQQQSGVTAPELVQLLTPHLPQLTLEQVTQGVFGLVEQLLTSSLLLAA